MSSQMELHHFADFLERASKSSLDSMAHYYFTQLQHWCLLVANLIFLDSGVPESQFLRLEQQQMSLSSRTEYVVVVHSIYMLSYLWQHYWFVLCLRSRLQALLRVYESQLRTHGATYKQYWPLIRHEQCQKPLKRQIRASNFSMPVLASTCMTQHGFLDCRQLDFYYSDNAQEKQVYARAKDSTAF